MARGAIAGAVLLLAACGGGAAEPATVTVDAGSPSSVVGPVAFVMTVEVVPHDGGSALHVGRLDGVVTADPRRVELSGTVHDASVTLVSDGTRWWDLADAGDTLTDDEVEAYLAASGFVRPEDVPPLLAAEQRWETVGTDEHLGVPVTHLRRVDVVKDLDWGYGDLAAIDVWRDEAGGIAKIVARWATGDNEGFPVSTWERTGRDPDVTITIPEG